MFSFDTITRLIVGRAAAERSDYRRLDRMYKDAEANLKLITQVTRASTVASSTESVYGSSACSGDIRARTQALYVEATEAPTLKRALSTPTVANFLISGSPDELKRTHSDSHLKMPSSPLPQMTGFGKYRRAVNASASWQLNQLEHHLQNDGDIIADFLGEEPPMGLDAGIWHQYRTTRVQQLRESRSAASSIYRSSRTNSSTTASGTPITGTPVTDASSEYTDPITGTRIVRGFNISHSSTTSNTTSAASSCKRTWTPVSERKRVPFSAFSRVQRYNETNPAAFECAVESDDDDDDDDEEDDDWEDMD